MIKRLTLILILCLPVPVLGQITTGPAVGQKIPAFSAVDQTGKIRNFESLRGSKGLVLFFNRSVDW